ncbi:MAG TPA: hypothetical protein VN682_14600 [Terriglobales bacterium]|nr:hypothetical protein [Terriglobales bacterium]
MTEGDPVRHPSGFYPLQLAIAQFSYRIWQDLWNEKYPDRFGQAWEGEDFQLMSAWREDVRRMIIECGQGAVLAMNAEEYVAKLIAANATGEAAEEMAEWLSELKYQGTTPSTQVIPGADT